MNFRRVFDHVFTVEVVVASCVFAIVALAMVYGLTRYRGGRRREASQDTEHPRVEALYALGLVAIAVSLYIFTYQANGDEKVHTTPSVTVAVTGFQWCWRFHYVEPSADVAGDCQSGRYPQLVLPAGQTVAFLLRSDDVIHSFWIPHVRWKMDMFAAHTNRFLMTMPTQPATWSGHCVEYCGLEHDAMLFTVRTLPRAEYATWVAAQARRAASRP